MTVRATLLTTLLAAPLLTLPISSSWAQDTHSLMVEGAAAARAEDWPRALRSFEQAAESGMASGQLFYNLGVSRFHLGDLSGARAAFTRAAEYPEMAGLAWYNVGLVESRLDRPDAARAAFLQVFDTTRNPRLLALADVELEKLAAADSHRRTWRLHAYASAGVDTALIDPVNPSGDYRADLFTETGAIGSISLTGDLERGTRLELSTGTTRYARLASYDFSTYAGDLSYGTDLRSWNVRSGVRLDQSALGGTDYLRSSAVYADGWHPLGSEWLGGVGLQLSNISALAPDYTALEGNRQRLSLQLARRGPVRFGARYSTEVNERQDLATSTTFTSYSPVRHGVDVTLRRTSGTNAVTATAGYRLSSYSGIDLLSDGTRIRREDRMWQVGLAWSRPLANDIRLQADYGHIDNQSNISAYSYTQHLVSLGLAVDL